MCGNIENWGTSYVCVENIENGGTSYSVCVENIDNGETSYVCVENIENGEPHMYVRHPGCANHIAGNSNI